MPAEAVLEQPEVIEGDGAELEQIDSPEGDAPDTTTLGDEDADLESPDPEDEPGEGEEVATPVEVDGRRMPDALKKAMVELKANGKITEAAAIRDVFHIRREYAEVFPKVSDAVAAKALIDQFGGPEGVEALTAERAEWEAIDKGFAEGSPEFVKSLADGNPEAFNKTSVNVVNEWAQRDPERYGFYRDSVSYNTIMQQPGVESGLHELVKLHAQLGEHPAAAAAVASVVNGIVGLRDRAQEFQSKRPDPEKQRFEQEKKQFADERRAEFEAKVDGETEEYLRNKMQPEIDRIINGRTVSGKTMELFHRLVKEEVEAKLREVPRFVSDYESQLRTGNQKNAVGFVTSKYNAILPNAVKVIEAYLRDINPGRKPAPTTGQPAANGKPRPASGPGEITLKEMPDHSQIDFTKCTVADVMGGDAVLKNGKRASGWM